MELKSDFTQPVKDAIDQYKFDRNPAPNGQLPEPLLSFPARPRVHFAVSNDEVAITTRLRGIETGFLPFNRGDHGAAGKPPDEQGGHTTAYLWRDVWERASWLEILGRYIVMHLDDEKRPASVSFPRFHQLDITRKLLRAVAERGAGGRYLIQHSAGSGKTKGIAWSAHFLSKLHHPPAADGTQKKVFDSVIVIPNRNVVHQQLQDEIFSFQRTSGVVVNIKGDGGSKSAELAGALSGSKKIVVCTIQTFPALADLMNELAKHQGSRFAVIADEAHTS